MCSQPSLRQTPGNFHMVHRCAKLLLLLAHLNYTVRIILSHLLPIATSVPSLHDHVTPDEACKMELKLWHQFLSSWNGISFLYDSLSHLSFQIFRQLAPASNLLPTSTLSLCLTGWNCFKAASVHRYHLQLPSILTRNYV